MANTREIRRRIKSIKNTSQITKAMQMVAASKMRKAQQQALAGRPFILQINKTLSALGDQIDAAEVPLMRLGEGNRHLVLVISTDKGLCGALNTNLLREAALIQGDVKFVSIGRKGSQYMARTKLPMLAEFSVKDNPAFLDTRKVSKFLMTEFLEGKFDKVSVLYTEFVNTLTQVPHLQQILPVTPFELRQKASEGAKQVAASSEANTFGPIFEPGPAEVLDAILPYIVHFHVYEAVLDSHASEQSARMVAMKNATDNAKQIVKDLTLEYNKVRQAGITTELLEISTAQAALDS